MLCLTPVGLEVHLTNLGVAAQHQIIWARQEEVSTEKYKSALSRPRAAGHGFTRWPLLKAARLAPFNSPTG